MAKIQSNDRFGFILLPGYFFLQIANRDADSKTSCFTLKSAIPFIIKNYSFEGKTSCFTLSDAVSLMDRYSILVFL
jgi:hypothetical protein